MTISTPLTRDALRRQDERELFEALDWGLRTAEAAAACLTQARSEGRWAQIKFLLGTLREKCAALQHDKQRPQLILPASATSGFSDMEH